MGKGAAIRPKREITPRFSRAEIKQMEKLLEEGKDELLNENFQKNLTEEFNRLPSRAGNKAIQVQQVQNWFKKRKNPATEATDPPNPATEATDPPNPATEATDPPNTSGELVHIVDTSQSNSAVPESSSDMPGDTVEKDPEQSELEFEARSGRDNAWYDVSTFLAHRIPCTGEPEVRVRFHGFGSDDDEWVNIKKDIRERSIPLESSECHNVEVGDLVLCFRERSEQAMYFDAHVLDIQRKLHDIRGCRCRFLIRYAHDEIQETVGLKRLCRRPKHDMNGSF